MNNNGADSEIAYKTCLNLAESGNIHAQYLLYIMLNEGKGTKKDAKKAAMWLRSAAYGGNNRAKIILIDTLSKGSETDHKEAYKICSSLAEKGHFGAQYRLGLMYWDGRGVDRDRKKAISWMKSSADGNYEKAILFLKRHNS